MFETILIILLLGGAAVVVAAALVGERKRREALERTLTELRLEAVIKPKGEARASAFAPFAHLGDRLRYGEKGVRWGAKGELERAHLQAIEHSYTVSTGKSSTTYYNTAAAVDAPASWPMLTLHEEHLLHKIGEMLGMRDLQLDSEAFNKRWRLKCDSEDFALLVLTPDVQRWLLNGPKGEWWAIGRGAVVCGRSARVKPAELGAFLRRAGEMRAMLPRELEAWGGPAGD